jgi:hypothetical protein
MMRSKFRHIQAALCALLLMFGAQSASACAVCFGKSDSNLALGMKWGVAVLLLVVFCVLGCISSFFIYLAKRSTTTSGSLAPAGQSETTHKVL